MTPLIPIVAAAVGGGIAYHRAKKKKGMTPERRKIFQNALKNVKEPAKLRDLAKTFDKEGLRAAGDELRKRAKLREMPEPVKKARSEAFRKGMSSKDPNGVLKLAKAFRSEGAYGAAKDLADYAKGLSARVANIFQSPKPTPAPTVAGEDEVAGEEEELEVEVVGDEDMTGDDEEEGEVE